MKVSRSRISKVIADKTLSSGVSKKLSREIAAYLLESHRTEELNSILRDVQSDWAEHGVIDAVATSAFPIPTETSMRSKALFENFTQMLKRLLLMSNETQVLLLGLDLSWQINN